VSEYGQIVTWIAEDFYKGRFDVSIEDRQCAPVSWSCVPHVECVSYLREADTPDRTIWTYITFVSAIDRTRESQRLWWNALELLESHQEVFDPLALLNVTVGELAELLSGFDVSQNKEQDPQAWLDIARTIALDSSCPVSRVIYGKTVDAGKLLKDLATRDENGASRFPLLNGRKTAAKWIRTLASPGGAGVAHIDSLPITVDRYVSWATENLGLSKKDKLEAQSDERYIQSLWRSAIADGNFEAPEQVKNTCAGLEPALSVFSRHGCGYCKKIGSPVRFGLACNRCRLFK